MLAAAAAAAQLRIGETRLLQVAFPALPPSLAFVDVNICTVTPIRHVPVSPVGTAPVARQPTDLARPAELVPAAGDADRVPQPEQVRQRQRIQVTASRSRPAGPRWSGPSRRSTDQLRIRVARLSDAGQPARRRTGCRWSTPARPADRSCGWPSRHLKTVLWCPPGGTGRTAYECLCTEIGLWAAGLRDPGGTVAPVTNLPGLPAGTRTVDVELPGFGTIRAVPVAGRGRRRPTLGPPAPVETGRGPTRSEDPPYGWPTADWPTDMPDTSELADYRAPGRAAASTLPAAR